MKLDKTYQIKSRRGEEILTIYYSEGENKIYLIEKYLVEKLIYLLQIMACDFENEDVSDVIFYAELLEENQEMYSYQEVFDYLEHNQYRRIATYIAREIIDLMRELKRFIGAMFYRRMNNQNEEWKSINNKSKQIIEKLNIEIISPSLYAEKVDFDFYWLGD